MVRNSLPRTRSFVLLPHSWGRSGRVIALAKQTSSSFILISHDISSDEGLAHQFLDEALARADASADASQAHGMLCGVLCAPHGIDTEEWMAEILDDGGHTNASGSQCRRLLLALHEDAVHQIGDDNMSFRLLLPGDGESLANRAEALAAWCEGFLYGMALGGLQRFEDLPDNAREILTDMSHFTRIDTEEDGEAAERAYVELVEYMRVGALLVNAEVHPAPPDHRGGESLH